MPMPQPRSDESQNDFISRCHSELSGEFPESDQRNAICFAQWSEGHGESPVEKKARDRFPAGRFIKQDNVCVFCEHETGDDESDAGVKYSLNELQQIVDDNNERILDTGDFTPLIDRHTPSERQIAEGAPIPNVVGYSGPYRLGMIGDVNPRYAVFADEYHYTDEHERISRMPRRSVELWKVGKKMFFDPIAALGATTPRLDLGMQFSRISGQQAQKYTYVAPSGGNTFIPNEDSIKSEKKERNMSDELVRKTVEAIEQLDWVKAIKQLLAQQGQAEEGGEAASELFAANDNESDDDKKTETNDGKKEDFQAEDDKDEDKKDKEDDKENFSRQGDVIKMSRTEFDNMQKDSADKYAALQSENDAIKATVGGLLKDKTDAKRSAVLDKLGAEAVIDVGDEKTKCLYSLGSTFSDDQFETHIDTITKYARKSPVGEALPIGELPKAQSDQDKFQMDRSQKIIQHADSVRAGGKDISYDDAAAHVDSLNGKA